MSYVSKCKAGKRTAISRWRPFIGALPPLTRASSSSGCTPPFKSVRANKSLPLTILDWWTSHPEPIRCAQGKLREGPLTGEVFSPNVYLHPKRIDKYYYSV